MRRTTILAAAILALGVSGAGGVSLVLGAGKLALGLHAGQVGTTFNIKFDL